MPEASDHPVSPLPSPRTSTSVDEEIWTALSKRVDVALRMLCFRYPKPTDDQFRHLLYNCIGHEVPDDIYFEKLLADCRSNVTTWQRKALETMVDWINTEIEYDGEDKFWSQENPELLFSYFFDTFHSENADAVFAHASFKWIISSPPGQDGSLDGASRWTKDFFCNLAARVKLHVDDFRPEEADREALISFYQNWYKDENGDERSEYRNVGLEDSNLKPTDLQAPLKKKQHVHMHKLFCPTPTSAPAGDDAGGVVRGHR